MNQLLSSKNSNFYNIEVDKPHKNKSKFYNFLFAISIILLIFLFVYLFIYMYNLYKRNKTAQNLVQSFKVSSLYSSDNNYTASFMSKSEPETSSLEPFVIGIIEIDKIKLHYPILSYSDVDSLKISPCRFAGPMPNEIGNLCIAGHNYIDNSFFGKLYLLNIGDIIKIYDLNGNMLSYKIYYKNEIKNSDFSCTSQQTNGKKVVTLMTCNTIKNTRVILVAQENK